MILILIQLLIFLIIAVFFITSLLSVVTVYRNTKIHDSFPKALAIEKEDVKKSTEHPELIAAGFMLFAMFYYRLVVFPFFEANRLVFALLLMFSLCASIRPMCFVAIMLEKNNTN